MRRISIVLALFSLLFVPAASTQQTATGNQANITRSGGGPDTIVNCAMAQNGRISVFTGAAPPNITLCNSAIYEAMPYGSGPIGILNANPIAALDVTGSINTSSNYQIGESSVLSIGSPADGNMFVGVGAGANNVAGSGAKNVFSGYEAGYSNTSGVGNVFSGYTAGYSNTTGFFNTFSGAQAGANNNKGAQNTFSGFGAGFANTTGGGNTFYGVNAGSGNTIESNNTFLGLEAGQQSVLGSDNTFTGSFAGVGNSGGFNTFSGAYSGNNNYTGSNNTFFGYQSGINNITGNSDIYIGSQGPGSGAESNTIRIGMQGTGAGQQNATFIAGIYGATVGGSGIAAYVDLNGQLGTTVSSLRFKEQVHDMGDSTNALMKLRPVTFLYKPEYAKGDRTLQYGLIAEEVADVYPDLVAYDNDGRPYTVRYQYITSMLLNEVQKQYRRAEAEARVITAQEQKIDELEQRLSRIESLVRAEVRTVAQGRE